MEAFEVTFKVWSETDEDAQKLGEHLTKFVNYHGANGRAVTARKLLSALDRWQDNAFVRNKIIKFFE